MSEWGLSVEYIGEIDSRKVENLLPFEIEIPIFIQSLFERNCPKFHFNLNDVSEGFWAFAQPGGLWWEVALGGIGRLSCRMYSGTLAILSILLLLFFDGNGNHLKLVFSSSLRGRSIKPFRSNVLMALLFLAPICAEYVMWTWSVIMHLWYAFLPLYSYFSNFLMFICKIL